jgi:ABC-2 type transport system permease protein
VITVSARARTARGALLVLLCGWVAMALVVPRVAAGAAEVTAPSTDAGWFWREIRAALKQGIDGHDPQGARQQALLARTLAQYGVSRAEDLPVSFAGIAMQEGEEYGNQVFDHFYGRLRAIEARQRMVVRVASLLSPWMALRGLSAGVAGTDAEHHWHYVHAAELYRRDLQRFLNRDFIRNARGQDFDYRAEPALWRETPIFTYRAPALRQVAGVYLPDALLLVGWLISSLAALWLAARVLTREGAMS